MKHLHNSLILLALTGCSVIPPEAYSNRGDPESLVTVSSEIVDIRLTDRNAMTQLSSLAINDPPSAVQLNCNQADALCLEVKSLFEAQKIPVQWGDQGGDDVTLVYEQAVARDCENRYIDNSINPYNLNHKALGCSVKANMVQMVSDKRQFTSPALLDFPDAEKGVQTYGNYMNPPKANNDGGLGESVVQSGNE